MSAAALKTLTIALVGNPNTGKSTLFSALAGVRQRVGNYPGVTVEKKVGRTTIGERSVDLVDLPGTYSLAPRSPDEMVTVDVLLGHLANSAAPDAVLCIVDASNLERNLYLVNQALELGLPTVVALNMMDLAEAAGVKIDVPRLERQLGVRVVPIQAHQRVGLADLRQALATAVGQPVGERESPFSTEFQGEVTHLEQRLAVGGRNVERFMVERLLLDTSGYVEQRMLPPDDRSTREALVAARARLAQAGQPVPAVEAIARYGWVGRVLSGVVVRESRSGHTPSDRLDRILCHKFLGVFIFAALMFIMFQAIFAWATPLMDLIDGGKEAVIAWIEGGDGAAPLMEEGPLRSLLTSGVIEGVGGVLIFLPQILILFAFIAVLEDCGYMARAAYLMDKLMAPLGLSGKSFIPLLSSFACAIPGVMAARVIENRRDRLLTILVAPLMSCSARLPVYILLIAAFIPDTKYVNVNVAGLFDLGVGLHGLTMFAMYLVGIVAAVLVTFTLRRTLLRGETPPFVMELPAYKWPSRRVVLSRVLDRGWAFVRRAGTLILAVMVLVWAATYYPRLDANEVAVHEREKVAIEAKIDALGANADQAAVENLRDQIGDIDNHLAGEQQRQSYLGRAGRWIEPVVKPLGWDWRIGCAAIASFPAREVVVGTMGVLYDLGEQDEESETLREKLQSATWDGTNEKVFNIPVALSIMVFFALCAQCAATLAVIKRETNSWRWPAFTFFYMTTLAYVSAFATYQIAMRIVG